MSKPDNYVVVPFRNGKCNPAIHDKTRRVPTRDTKTFAIKNSSDIRRICPKTGKILEVISNPRRKAA